MTTTKRRGRPRGTDYKEDSAALALVAYIIIANPGTRASTAMRQVHRGRHWRGASPSRKSISIAPRSGMRDPATRPVKNGTRRTHQ